MARLSIWLLSCIFLASCVLGELVRGPGGRLLNSDCHVVLPEGATVYGTDRIVLADGTVEPYPPCPTSNETEAQQSMRAAPAHDLENTDRKRDPDGWNLFTYFYPAGPSLDQFNGDWVVPSSPGVGYRGQLIYLFTGLEPSGYDPILQPVIWYGISPAGGGNAWFAAVWEVSGNRFTTSQVVRVYPGQTIHTTMIRYPGQAWQCIMYADGTLITGGNFADRDYNIAFTSLELYGVSDCWSLPYQTTTNFFNLAVHQTGVGFLNQIWTVMVTQTDCGQSATCSGTTCSLNYGLPALLSPLIFDAGYYKAVNPDLPWSDAANLQTHWITAGSFEGRQAVGAFSVNEYKAIYWDIAPLPNQAAILHYAFNGYVEGRVGRIILHPLAFDWVYYLNTYGDLLSGFGYNRDAVNNHWCNSGIYEGRQGVSTFWAPAYLSFYPDLQAAFGTNNVLATSHWVNNGHAEGRRGV